MSHRAEKSHADAGDEGKDIKYGRRDENRVRRLHFFGAPDKQAMKKPAQRGKRDGKEVKNPQKAQHRPAVVFYQLAQHVFPHDLFLGFFLRFFRDPLRLHSAPFRIDPSFYKNRRPAPSDN